MKQTLGSAPGPVAVLRGHDDAVVSLKYAASQNLYSGSANGKLLRWNMATLRPDVTLSAHDKSVISINEMDRGCIVTSSRDSTVKVWDCTSFEVPVSLLRIGYDHFCNSCTSSIQGSSVLVTPGIKQSQIFVWDLRAPQIPVQVIEPDETVGMVTSLFSAKEDAGFNTGEPVLFAGFEDGSVSAFDLRSSRRLCFQKVHAEPVFALHAHNSSTGLRVVSGGGDNILNRSAMTSSQAEAYNMSATDTICLKQPGTSCVKFRRDGRILVSAHWDHSVRVYDHKRMKPLAAIKHHRDSVYAVEFLCADVRVANVTNTSCGSTTDAGTEDDSDGATASLGKTEEVDPSGTDEGNTCGDVSAGCFATGSKDHTIAIWDLFADTFQS